MINFGRYSDSFPPKIKTDYWNQSEKLFEEKKYLDSYNSFFDYLKNDEIKNVTYTLTPEELQFQFYQGSRIIKGRADNKLFVAEAKIVSFEKLSVALMRRLMEMNYALYYSRFAINDSYICIKFNTSVLDGPPRKIYYALKELCTRADKQDDLLLEDFKNLSIIDRTDVIDFTPEEKELKYKYYFTWIDKSLKRISELNETSLSGALSYLLLDLLYKIDYLITPEGSLMNSMEKISFEYFTKDNKPFEEKNRNLKEAFQKLLEKPKDQVIKDFYAVKSTFGIMNPAPHQAAIEAINNNLNNVKWYSENNYEDIAVCIYEYLAGYCLFSYGLPKADIKFFDLIINILNQDYYSETGRKEIYYDNENKKLNESLIKERIINIVNESVEQFPELKFNTDSLKFDSLLNFLRTYFTELLNLNFNN
jgi:hypothetical protein